MPEHSKLSLYIFFVRFSLCSTFLFCFLSRWEIVRWFFFSRSFVYLAFDIPWAYLIMCNCVHMRTSVSIERLWLFLLLASKRINVLDDLKAINVYICCFCRCFSYWAFRFLIPSLKNYGHFHIWRYQTKNDWFKRLKSNHHPWNGIQIWIQAPFSLLWRKKSYRFVCQHLIWFLLKYKNESNKKGKLCFNFN